MFQYALGRALSNKFNTNLVVDSTFFQKNVTNSGTTTRSLELDIFNLPIREVSKSELNNLKPPHLRILNTIFHKFDLSKLQLSNYFFENHIGFNEKIRRVKDNSFLSGYWQSYLYFIDIQEIIINEFQFPSINDLTTKLLAKQILQENSISIHIRRGDFLNNDLGNVHSICPISYYKDAMNYINTKVDNPKYFVFSDDVEWVKTNLIINAVFVSENRGKSSFVDMQLMSLCKFNIIANSSFSWWGAWLNKNPQKIIIAPQKWYNNEFMNNETVDLIPKSWIRI
jgi:hypothetical protein